MNMTSARIGWSSGGSVNTTQVTQEGGGESSMLATFCVIVEGCSNKGASLKLPERVGIVLDIDGFRRSLMTRRSGSIRLATVTRKRKRKRNGYNYYESNESSHLERA
jgi:hypothetical protein